MSRKSPVISQANLLAGTRHPLPGQSADHEERLRAELAGYFVPDGPVEAMWVADIAYCMSEIEVLRAQIAGFRMIAMEQAHRDSLQVGNWPDIGLYEQSSGNQKERAWREIMAGNGFIAPSASWLDQPAFTGLLGAMSSQKAGHLRMLEQMMFELARERDRIVNQIERRRRQAMRDAIEKAQARYQVEIDGEGAMDIDSSASAIGLAEDPASQGDIGNAAESRDDEVIEACGEREEAL